MSGGIQVRVLNENYFYFPCLHVCAKKFAQDWTSYFFEKFSQKFCRKWLKCLSHIFWREFLAKKSQKISLLYRVRQTCLRKSCHLGRVLQLSKWGKKKDEKSVTCIKNVKIWKKPKYQLSEFPKQAKFWSFFESCRTLPKWQLFLKQVCLTL